MTGRRLLTVSPSSLGTWLDCPRAYRLRYLDRPRPALAPQRAVVSIGNTAHAALSRFWELDVPDRVPRRVAELVGEHWQSAGFRDRAQRDHWRPIVTGWVVDYLRGMDRSADPLAVERTVAMPAEGLALQGRVDRLDDRDGELVVVDYKTGRHPPGPDAARTSLALGLYAVAVSRMWRRPCTEVELHHVPSRTVRTHRHTEASAARKLAEAESIGAELREALAAHAADGADAGAFPARPSPLCRWCAVQQHCAEGLQVGAAHPGWAGLEALEGSGQSPVEDASAP